MCLCAPSEAHSGWTVKWAGCCLIALNIEPLVETSEWDLFNLLCPPLPIDGPDTLPGGMYTCCGRSLENLNDKVHAELAMIKAMNQPND